MISNKSDARTCIQNVCNEHIDHSVCPTMKQSGMSMFCPGDFEKWDRLSERCFALPESIDHRDCDQAVAYDLQAQSGYGPVLYVPASSAQLDYRDLTSINT